jgi:hypothetical protein
MSQRTSAHGFVAERSCRADGRHEQDVAKAIAELDDLQRTKAIVSRRR